MSAIEAFRYDRAGIGNGEWWRLLTGHLVHLDAWHAALNALGLIVLWLLFRRDYTPRQWWIIIAACVAAIDAGLWLIDPQIEWYVGASGVLHGIMAAGALSRILRGQREGWVLGLLLGSKLYEQHSGPLPLTHGIPVVVDAHLYGALGGVIASAAIAVIAAVRSKPQQPEAGKTDQQR